jgi:hypothetical protein
MTSTNNQTTRALVSALRSDHVSLRKAAAEIIDNATAGSDVCNVPPYRALMAAFNSTHVTANVLLRERARVNRAGARKS